MRIKVFKGEALVSTHAFDASIIKIGRLPNSQLRLDGEGVARIHAVIEQQAGGASVIDLGSSLGTLVNGQRVAKAALQAGDEVLVGPFRLVIDPSPVDDLEDAGVRLAAIRPEVRALLGRGEEAAALALVRDRAGLSQAEAEAYLAGLRA